MRNSCISGNSTNPWRHINHRNHHRRRFTRDSKIFGSAPRPTALRIFPASFHCSIVQLVKQNRVWRSLLRFIINQMEKGWARVDEDGGRCIIVQPGAHYFRDRIVGAASIPLMSNGRSNNDFAGFRNRPREQRCVGSNRLARTLHPTNLDDHRQHTGVDKICITFRDVAGRACTPLQTY